MGLIAMMSMTENTERKAAPPANIYVKPKGGVGPGDPTGSISMTSKPLVEVALRLIGQAFSPGDVTAAVGLTPTKTWHRGDYIQGTLLQRKDDGWSFGLPQRETYEMDALLRELLDAIEPHKTRIAEAADRLHLDVEVSFGIYIRGETPASWFAAETIHRLASIRAGLDVDLILTE